MAQLLTHSELNKKIPTNSKSFVPKNVGPVLKGLITCFPGEICIDMALPKHLISENVGSR